MTTLFQMVDVPAVRAVLGSNPLRFWPWGRAGKNPLRPYAVHRTVNGVPDNSLSDLPTLDYFERQVDVYADEADDAEQAAIALRNAIEAAGAYVIAWRGEDRDPATNRYVYSFDVAFHTSR